MVQRRSVSNGLVSDFGASDSLLAQNILLPYSLVLEEKIRWERGLEPVLEPVPVRDDADRSCEEE